MTLRGRVLTKSCAASFNHVISIKSRGNRRGNGIFTGPYSPRVNCHYYDGYIHGIQSLLQFFYVEDVCEFGVCYMYHFKGAVRGKKTRHPPKI